MLEEYKNYKRSFYVQGSQQAYLVVTVKGCRKRKKKIRFEPILARLHVFYKRNDILTQN